MSNAKKLIDELAYRNLTIGSVESFTGGLFAKTLTDVSGASKVFKGALVTYSTETKSNLLGIPEEYIEEKGVVSAEVCQQMAIKGRKLLNVDICVAFTGNAGPTVCQLNTEVGTCFMSVAYKGTMWSFPLKLEMERNTLKQYCVDAVIDTVLSVVAQSN